MAAATFTGKWWLRANSRSAHTAVGGGDSFPFISQLTHSAGGSQGFEAQLLASCGTGSPF